MRKLLRALGGLGAAVLLVWLFSTLVTPAGDAPSPVEASSAAAVMYAQAQALPTESVMPVPDRAEKEARVRPEDERPFVCALPMHVLADGNGWLIVGKTWPKTVYAVCPPEGMPG